MRSPIDLSYPFAGRWLVRNSPANRVPSHGTEAFASAYAIDFVPVDESGRSAPFTFASAFRPESAEAFPGFGRPILAPVPGVVVAVHDGEVDHPAYRGLPSVQYALTQGRRAADGWRALAGNHVLIERGDLRGRSGTIVALCHLQRGSVVVHPGQQLAMGDVVGQCGNSGNSTEPHVHVQAFRVPALERGDLDRTDISSLDAENSDARHMDVERAEPVPLTFEGALPFNGEVVEA